MEIIYEEVTPSPIANAIVVKGIVNGVHRNYQITPVDNYVLHDRRSDIFENHDEDGNGIGEPTVMLFASGGCSVRYDYDFTSITAGTITDIDGNEIAVNKVGAYELFAIPSSSIPADQIYGGGDTDHEVM